MFAPESYNITKNKNEKTRNVQNFIMSYKVFMFDSSFGCIKDYNCFVSEPGQMSTKLIRIGRG